MDASVIANTHDVVIANSTFYQNTAGTNGGGFNLTVNVQAGTSTTNLTNDTFFRNVAH